MLRLCILLLVLASPTAADSPEERARQAAGGINATGFISDAKRAEVIHVPQSSSDGGMPAQNLTPQQMRDQGSAIAASSGTAGDLHGIINDGAPSWGASQVPVDALDKADHVASRPYAHLNTSMFSAFDPDGNACTVDNFQSAPSFIKVCDRQRFNYEATCLDSANVVADRYETIVCKGGTAGGSFTPNIHCSFLHSNSLCTYVSGGCTSVGGGGDCTSYRADYFCGPNPGIPSWIFGTPNYELADVTYNNLQTTWERSCSAEYETARCELLNRSCPGGPVVKTIGNLVVPLDCENWTDEFICVGDEINNSECDLFENGGCGRLNSTCLSSTPSGICVTFEDEYECGSPEATPGRAQCADVTVCVGGYCETVANQPDTDLALAATHVEVLNDMAANNPVTGELITSVAAAQDALSFFSGNAKSCRDVILGALDCCTDSGWANGTFGQCHEDELIIMAANHAQAAVYMRTYCSDKLLFICLEKSREYCVYGSKLARIISVQAQDQLGNEYECRGLTYNEIAEVDFSLLDLSEIYADMLAKMTVPNTEELVEMMRENVLAIMPAP